MLFQSSFDDRFLVESFYGELFDRFYTVCNSRIQLLLQDCSFGIAPNANKVITFFIVAPNRDAADKLMQYIDSIIDQAVELMPGIKQTAICYIPYENQVEEPAEMKKFRQNSSQFMVAKFFPNISVS